MAGLSRAKAAREARRAAQFSKFRFHQLNLIPLVDTMVSIVFFALTTQTLGELAPVASGVNLPEARVGNAAYKQLTLAISSSPARITFADRPIMTVQQAAAVSNDPKNPLLIPALYTPLKAVADSIRQARNLGANQSVDIPLAIQGDKQMRYDLLSRVLQTARLAGFKSLTLQVHHTTEGAVGTGQTT